MATRQYIGARYVPKFYTNSVDASTQWEANVVYDPLIYVTLINGHMYISKKQVPATIGTPAENTEYWLDIGSYNGFIDNLQAQIDLINNTTIPALEKSTERNIIVIGNSFVNSGVADELVADFDASYEYLGSGIGFTQYSGHTDTFESKLDAAIIDSSFDNDDITDILFVSAMGDTISLEESEASFTTNLPLTLASIETKIKTNFPNCNRVMVTLAETRSVAYFTFSKYSTIFAIHRVFKNTLSRYNMEYLGWSGFNVMLAGSQYTESDNYHPSTLGAKMIGGFIKASYYGHAEYVTKRTVAHIPFKYTATAKVTTVAKFTPDEVQINLMVVRDTYGTPVAIGALAEIISFDDLPIAIPPCSDYAVYCTSDLVDEGNGTKIDRFIMEVGRPDTHGVAQAWLVNAPTSSAIASSVSLMPSINNITYFI